MLPESLVSQTLNSFALSEWKHCSPSLLEIITGTVALRDANECQHGQVALLLAFWCTVIISKNVSAFWILMTVIKDNVGSYSFSPSFKYSHTIPNYLTLYVFLNFLSAIPPIALILPGTDVVFGYDLALSEIKSKDPLTVQQCRIRSSFMIASN